MASDHDNPIRQYLANLICDPVIEAYAQKLGVVERRRKIDVVCLVWTLILGFSSGSRRTLASLRRAYQAASGHLVAPSSFYDRLTPALARLMRQLLAHILRVQRESLTDFHGERMRGFDRLLAMDATILRLHGLLAPVYPGCRTNHTPAAAKLHMVMNVVDGSPNRIRLTDERTGDGGPWKRLGAWVKGSLLLFDLGYYDFHFFHRIDKRGGYFLSRLKSTANPRIIEDLSRGPGRRCSTEGKKLQEVLGHLKREVFEATVEVPVKLRAYKGRRRTIKCRFRLIAIRDEKTRNYHLYLTNTESERLLAEDARAVYALRWQVEIVFKQLRSMGRIDHLPTSSPAIVEVLIYGAILALALSNRLLNTMRRLARDRVLPILRFYEVFRSLASEILLKVTLHRRRSPINLFELLFQESIDPNLIRDRSENVVWEL